MSATPWVLWVAGSVAFMLVALGMPLAIRGWKALGRKDREVSLRKVHTGEIPRVGGFVLMLGFAIVAIRGLAGTTELSAAHEWFSRNSITGAVLGALICGGFGLFDAMQKHLGRALAEVVLRAAEAGMGPASVARIVQAAHDMVLSPTVVPFALGAAERALLEKCVNRADLVADLYADYPLVYVTGPDERDVALTVSSRI